MPKAEFIPDQDLQNSVPGAGKIYRVSEITREIKLLLDGHFPVVWVEGEISNFKRHSSGHIYFTLKDEAAQLNAVFFSRANQSLNFDLKDGLKVVCVGRVSVYEVRGSYQLYVERVHPKGLGELQLAFLQMKEKLEKEGLFEESRKKPIPSYPRTVGIVTSATGAALQDMLKVFQRRPYGLHILINPVKVQGEGSAAEVARAIDAFNRMQGIDVLIVGRGGGSLEDLWAFNEEVLARAVSRSQIPVISAVGHEIDWTICDFVADFRAHTPTAAAEQIVLHWDQLEERLREYRERMQTAIQNQLHSTSDRFRDLASSYAFRQPLSHVQQMAQRTDELLRQLQNYSKNLLETKCHQFENLAGQLHALSPLAILERGFSITFDSAGHVLRSARGARPGEIIKTRLSQGEIKSKVIQGEE